MPAAPDPVHLLRERQIAAIDDEKNSLMPPLRADDEELQNLIAYLSKLTGVKPGATNMANSAALNGIPWSRILDPRPGDWLSYNGRLSGNRYSDVTQINTTNVNALRLKWIFSVDLWGSFFPIRRTFAKT